MSKVQLLKQRAVENLDRYTGRHLRMVVSGEEFYDVEKLRIETYNNYNGADVPAIIKRAEAFRNIVLHMQIRIEHEEMIVGSQKFCAFTAPDLPDAHWDWVKEKQRDLDIAFSDGHIVVDYGKVLKYGMKGIIEMIDKELSLRGSDLRRCERLNAFRTCADAAGRFGYKFSKKAVELAEHEQNPIRQRELMRISEICAKVPYLPAEHFDEALQSIWFTQILMHVENPCSAISLGRFDQYVYPFLKNDLETGYITMEQAQEIIDCLWIKFLEGDESQNLTVGGITVDGTDATNIVTYMAINATLKLSAWQPSVSVRLHKNSPPELLNKVCELVKIGIGQPSIFNDELIIDALKWQGLSDKDAVDYSIVGCYEATGSGNEYGLTTAVTMNFGEAIYEYIQQLALMREDAVEISDFDNFIDGFKKYITLFMDRKLEQCEEMDQIRRVSAPSPFKSLLMEGCIEHGVDVENGGTKYNYFSYNVLGVATVGDSLAVIKKIVFDEEAVDVKTFANALESNYLGYEELRSIIKSFRDRYGNDCMATDAITADIVEHICNESRKKELSRGAEGYVGLFAFLQNVAQRNTPATPDGRRKGDFMPYAIAPSIGAAKEGVTAILNSAARLPQSHAPGGCPITISLMPKYTKGDGGTELIKWIIRTYFDNGGFHLHFNIVKSDDLVKAQQYPENYGDLMVRISGYSARFIALNQDVQDEIISRVKEGI